MTLCSVRYTVILLALLLLSHAQIVPIYPSKTKTIRIFCYSHQTYLVSFQPDTKCALDCGYVQGLESCCIDIDINHSQDVYCYRSSNKTNFASVKSIQFSARIITTNEEVHRVTNQSQSVLTCLSDTNNTTLSSTSISTTDQFYFKFAYLYSGFTDRFGTFYNTVRTPLPANEETVMCNGTRYKFDYEPDCGLSEQIVEHVATLRGGHDDIKGKYMWSIWGTAFMVPIILLQCVGLLAQFIWVRQHTLYSRLYFKKLRLLEDSASNHA